MHKRFLIPKLQIFRWSSDGAHDESTAEGRSFIFAWLGLHLEIVVGVEKAWLLLLIVDDHG